MILQLLSDRLAKLEKQVSLNERQARAEYAGGVARFDTSAQLPPDMAGRAAFVRDLARPNGASGELVYNDGSDWVGVHDYADYALYSQYTLGLFNYIVADLPAPPSIVAGTTPCVFATDARKAGEGAGAGTGLPVYWNAATNAWLTFYDNSAVLD